MKFATLALFLVTCFGLAAAEEFPDISHTDLAAAVKSGKVILLDCNNTLLYKKNHIPGALDFGKVKADLPKLLPADKSSLIVAYCKDPDCVAYLRAASAAKELGYTNVKHYSGGIVGWLKEKEPTEGESQNR